jgi:hypothetical protein
VIPTRPEKELPREGERMGGVGKLGCEILEATEHILERLRPQVELGSRRPLARVRGDFQRSEPACRIKSDHPVGSVPAQTALELSQSSDPNIRTRIPKLHGVDAQSVGQLIGQDPIEDGVASRSFLRAEQLSQRPGYSRRKTVSLRQSPSRIILTSRFLPTRSAGFGHPDECFRVVGSFFDQTKQGVVGLIVTTLKDIAAGPQQAVLKAILVPGIGSVTEGGLKVEFPQGDTGLPRAPLRRTP